MCPPLRWCGSNRCGRREASGRASGEGRPAGRPPRLDDGGISTQIADDKPVEQPVSTGRVVKDMKHSGRSGREPAGR
jgi:hypothetical protein